MGYTKSVIRGVSWVSAFRLLTRLVTFLKIAILARILSPSQFGLFGIASLVLAFLELLTETGINIFIVQSKKDINDYVDSAWVVSITRGCIIAVIIFLVTPLIAAFFNAPGSIQVLYLISLVPLLRGFINPAIGTLQKNLDFSTEFWLKTVIFITDAAVSIIGALVTSSVYSLVWGMIVGVCLEVILSFILIKPRPRFSIKKNYFYEIFHSGKWVTLYGIFHYFAQEGDNIVVGRLLGTSSLGVYQMAYKISILPISEVGDVVSRVIFPVYTKISDDRERLLQAFKKSMIAIALPSIFIGGIIFLFPDFIVRFLLGDKWLTAIPVLKILAIYGVLRAVSGPASALFLGVHKQQYVTIMLFFRCLILFLSIFPLVQLYGMVGAAYAAIISVLVEIPIIIFFTIKVFSLKNKKRLDISG